MARVYLPYNQLVVFEEGVFKEILQQMVSAQPPVGYVFVQSSTVYSLKSMSLTSFYILLVFYNWF